MMNTTAISLRTFFAPFLILTLFPFHRANASSDIEFSMRYFVNDVTTAVDSVICTGDSAFFESQWQLSPGIYTDIFAITGGFDSTVVTTLHVLDGNSSGLNYPDSLCQFQELDLGFISTVLGYSWTISQGTWSGSQSTISGWPKINRNDTVFFVFSNDNAVCGLPTQITDTAIVIPPSDITSAISLCIGDSVLLGGIFRSQAGFYSDTSYTNLSCIILDHVAVCLEDCYGGCTDSIAYNFNSLAPYDNGSCIYLDFSFSCGEGTIWDPSVGFCVTSCQEDFDFDGQVNTADLLAFLTWFGTDCP